MGAWLLETGLLNCGYLVFLPSFCSAILHRTRRPPAVSPAQRPRVGDCCFHAFVAMGAWFSTVSLQRINGVGQAVDVEWLCCALSPVVEVEGDGWRVEQQGAPPMAVALPWFLFCVRFPRAFCFAAFTILLFCRWCNMASKHSVAGPQQRLLWCTGWCPPTRYVWRAQRRCGLQ
jgi:hypothetical protein